MVHNVWLAEVVEGGLCHSAFIFDQGHAAEDVFGVFVLGFCIVNCELVVGNTGDFGTCNCVKY